ncbi:hypothetical protein DRH14_03420 [Candidatus Shapirobacteria bacterium]|nr:MAG: hypothetical protein DRH14_03420 [Candidatus Shapirobacteria bacterium]
MSKKMKLLIVVGMVLFRGAFVYGWAGRTHGALTVKAVSDTDQCVLDNYLKEVLDMNQGIASKHDWQIQNTQALGIPDDQYSDRITGIASEYYWTYETDITDLLEFGAKLEDIPAPRAKHHFYDPIANRGLDNQEMKAWWTERMDGFSEFIYGFTADMLGDYVIQLVVNDGKEDSNPDMIIVSTSNISPVANAGEDQAVYVGDMVTLDGSSSSDADGDILSFIWAFTAMPQGSQASLSDVNSVNPTFVVDVPGIYVVSLMVNDGTVDSVSDTVSISTINVAPIADGGSDQAVYVGETVNLDSGNSFDPDGDELTYLWSFVTRPADSTAILSEPNAATPSFIADVSGTYVVGLVVNDGIINSAPDTVSASTINVSPVANAGQDQSVYLGQTVLLDGSSSYDSDGDEITYQWAFVQVPDGSAAVLEGATTVYPDFIPDLPGIYTLNLAVSDGLLQSQPDSVTVSVATYATTVILKVQNIIDVINSFNGDVFKNSNRRKALTNKLNSVIEKLEYGQYQDALNKLENDILKKTDGCCQSGEPEKNDWIIDCEAQEEVYPLILDVIELLDDM